MWQISGPPLIFMTSSVQLQTSFKSVWGPILRAVLKNRGSANRPKMDQFEIFLIIHCTKSKMKGGLFYEKNANSCIWGPILRAVFKKGGSANRPRMDRFEKFCNFFSHKIRIQRGSVLWKNVLTHVLQPYSAGRFGQMGVSANRPKLDQFWRLKTFSCTKSKFKGGIFYEKNCHLI